jgi:Domain of unknown function (DUF1707)
MDDSIRVSDADRDRVTRPVARPLRRRITPGEVDERLSAALNAKTFGDLRRRGPVPALLGAAPPTLRIPASIFSIANRPSTSVPL